MNFEFEITPELNADQTMLSLVFEFVESLNFSEDIEECLTHSESIMARATTSSDKLRSDLRILLSSILKECIRLNQHTDI